jgi:hypothetical protein
MITIAGIAHRLKIITMGRFEQELFRGNTVSPMLDSKTLREFDCAGSRDSVVEFSSPVLLW